MKKTVVLAMLFVASCSSPTPTLQTQGPAGDAPRNQSSTAAKPQARLARGQIEPIDTHHLGGDPSFVLRSRASATAPEYLGLVAFRSVWGKHLQAVEHNGHFDNGELHASNSHVNEEESWLLFSIDNDKGIFRLENFQTKAYLSRTTGAQDCPKADARNPGALEAWILGDGATFGRPGRVFIKSVATGKYLTAQNESNDTHCGGEVWADIGGEPSRAADWQGWWSVENAPDPPTSGRSVFTVFGDIGHGFIDVVEAIAHIFDHVHFCTDHNPCN